VGQRIASDASKTTSQKGNSMFFPQLYLQIRTTINMVKYVDAHNRGYSRFSLSGAENESDTRETVDQGIDCEKCRDGSTSSEQKEKAASSFAAGAFKEAGITRDRQ
jgi:hypothetical protein